MCVQKYSQTQTIHVWSYDCSPQEKKKKANLNFFCQLPSGLAGTQTRVSSTFAQSYSPYTNTVVLLSPEQCVLHCSLLVSRWEWFVGKVGELTLWWANNNNTLPKNTFSGSHHLCVWLITPGMSSGWLETEQLAPCHSTTTPNPHWHKGRDDKATVHPSAVFLTGRDKGSYCSGEWNTNMFYVVVVGFFMTDFWEKDPGSEQRDL